MPHNVDLVIYAIALLTSACGGAASPKARESGSSAQVPKPSSSIGDASKPATEPGDTERATQQTPSGLRYVDLALGQGELAEPGHQVVIHYVGTLVDDSVFDSSRERGTPFEFGLGKNQVIRGFDEGVTGMRVGGKRRLLIPPDLGYGERGSPPKIPPSSVLIFEVELLDVRE